MTILGVGTDICHIVRIQEILEKHNQFIKRLLTEYEIEQAPNFSAAFVAKRFAAKEAVAKALGTGIGQKLAFHDFEIIREGNNPPQVKMLNTAYSHIKFHLSLSDEKEYAVAFVVAEK